MNRVPLELQSEAAECGLACLAMVAGAFAQGFDLADLRRRFPGAALGLTLKQLAGHARRLGLVSRGVRLEPGDLHALRRPAILHWNLDHFVVLVRVTRRGLWLHDPASGRVRVPWAEVDRCFTGVALELWPGDQGMAEPPPASSLTLADLWRMVRGGAQHLGWVVALSVLLQVLLLAGPWHMQWIVDHALLAGDAQLIHVLAVGFALLLALRCAVHWLRGAVVVHLGHNLAFVLACRLLTHLLHLPLDWFERRRVGDIASRFAALHPVREFLTQGGAALLVDGAMVLLSAVAMLAYSPLLAGVVAALQTVFVLVYLALVPRLRRLNMAAVVAQAAEQSHLLESVRAIHSVKVYAREGERLGAWQKLHAHGLARSMSVQHTHLGVGALGLLCGGAELILVITLGAQAILEEAALTVGALFAFMSYRGHFSERLRGVVEQWVALKTLRVHLARVADIWLSEPETGTDHAPAGSARSTTPGDLHVERVSFGYAPDQAPLIDAVDLRVPPGAFAAITGPSGAGKSTLLKLMMGLLAPDAGHVMAGGWPVARVRAQFGCVLQQDGFFSGSVADNIALFEAPDLDRLHASLAEVGMLDEIRRLPMGLATRIGDIGSHFSSGQMQRLMLARAIYARPQYLFLDEGTAHLDRASAAFIHARLRALTCTRVVVTHDLRFAACADHVWWLEAGQLQAVGPSGLELQQFGVQGGEIDNADGVVARHVPGALPRVEDGG